MLSSRDLPNPGIKPHLLCLLQSSLVKSGCEVFRKYFEDAEPRCLDVALVKLLMAPREDEKCLLLFLAPASPLNS